MNARERREQEEVLNVLMKSQSDISTIFESLLKLQISNNNLIHRIQESKQESKNE